MSRVEDDDTSVGADESANIQPLELKADSLARLKKVSQRLLKPRDVFNEDVGIFGFFLRFFLVRLPHSFAERINQPKESFAGRGWLLRGPICCRRVAFVVGATVCFFGWLRPQRNGFTGGAGEESRERVIYGGFFKRLREEVSCVLLL